MKLYRLTWNASGTAEVEADSAAEAEELLSEAVLGLDAHACDSFQVDDSEAYADDDEDEGVDIVAEERALRVV